MKNINERLGFVGPAGGYPTIFSPNTYSYYEQLCAIAKIITELNEQVESMLTALEGKQDTLTFDNAPRNGSSNPVTSNGIYAADLLLSQSILAVAQLAAGKQDQLTFDNEPLFGSPNPVTSDGIYQSLHNLYTRLLELINGKQNQLEFDNEPLNGSSNPVTSDGIYDALRVLSTAIDGKQDTLTFDTTPTENSTNPCTSGGIFDFVKTLTNALTTDVEGKQDKVISVSFKIDPFDWTADNGVYYYNKAVTGVKANAALAALNDDNTTQFGYVAAADRITVSTTSVVGQTVTFNIIAFNDPDART